ncbi:MAG: FAD-dependent oxidoreductase [Pigmentiphaga sp.]
MSSQLKTPVLIVGGGPVGLCLALDLAWRGVECMLIEKTDGAIHHPKTASLTYRTMEFCRRWGIGDRIRHETFPRDWELSMAFCTSMAGYPLTRIPYPSLQDDQEIPETPERKQRAPQLYFDPILADEAKKRDGITLRYHCELISHAQDENGVCAVARDTLTGETIIIEAQYLVACDGAGSGVRRTLDIPMEGDPVLDYSMAVYVHCPDLIHKHDKGQAERYIFIGPSGTWGNLTVVDADAYWRLTVLGFKSKEETEGFDPEPWVRRCMGTDDIAFEVVDVLPWRRAKLVAREYSQGRVFLAGDSAHTMSPTGGFGFNTGLGDAIDLTWKLEGVLKGWGGPELLASYDAERRPIGWRNVGASAENYFKLISAENCANSLEDTPEGAETRKRVGAYMHEATRMEWENLGVTLGYRYENSPICVPDGSAPTPDQRSVYAPTSQAGHRAPHAWLPDGRSTLDLFGRSFVLLRFPGAPDTSAFVAAAQECGLPLEVVDIADEAIARLYERKLVLVRPDGHSAWRADAVPNSVPALLDRIRGALVPAFEAA